MAKTVWSKNGVRVEQRGLDFYVLSLHDGKLPAGSVVGPLPTVGSAVDWAKDYFFGVQAARERNVVRAQKLADLFKLRKRFDYLEFYPGEYLAVLTTVARAAD